MGAVQRDSEREGNGERADMYCGCLMTGKERRNGSAVSGETCGEREIGAQTE